MTSDEFRFHEREELLKEVLRLKAELAGLYCGKCGNLKHEHDELGCPKANATTVLEIQKQRVKELEASLASARAALRYCRDVLTRMNMTGGLGLGIHAAVDGTLVIINEALASPEKE